MHFLNLTPSIRKKEIINEISNEIKFDWQYFILLIFSIILATLGIIIQNNAVIIGAMIISPFIWPIVGLSFSTVIVNKDMFIKAITLLAVSIILVITVSFTISLITPLKEVTPEIINKVNPTIIDLVIALVAGAAAGVIIGIPQLSGHLAGVAVAASTLPPICMVGVGFAYKNIDVVFGSVLFFLTNLTSIIFSGIVVFVLSGFYKKDSQKQKKIVELGFILSLLTMIIISFQLFYSLNKIILDNQTNQIVKEVLTKELENLSSEIKITRINVVVSDSQKDIIDISATLQVPSDYKITIDQKNIIAKELKQQLGSNISLDIEIIPVLKVVAQEKKEDEKDKIESQIEQFIIKEIKSMSDDILIESVIISIDDKTKIKTYNVIVTLLLPDDLEFAQELKDILENVLKNEIQNNVNLIIRTLNYQKL